jgi:hypothetical protein
MKKEIRNKRLVMKGDRDLKTSVDDWFNYSLFHNPQAFEDSLS